MVNDIKKERSSLLLSSKRQSRKQKNQAPKENYTLVKSVEAAKPSIQPYKPNEKDYIRTWTGNNLPTLSKAPAENHLPALKHPEKITNLSTETQVKEENDGPRCPPIFSQNLNRPKQTKVSFLPSRQILTSRRRLSVQEQTLYKSSRPILKTYSARREKIRPAAPTSSPDLSVLWNLPWERELYFPPINNNGVLVFLDDDGNLPPMLKRLHNNHNNFLNFSQEFQQVLSNLKDTDHP
ncbi:hypothetical protein XELAEV_18024076mg [Xenopus laevis]|uniref:Uncharacterized protein n=1 Tax=Xenopus laevis TaxID=8355 RepID=A0A974HPP5_XENLA|nr:hypothetical protein XELAEV_18024076mg [Xenopus laevis]